MPGTPPLKVLIVDDSPTVQLNIRQILDSALDFQIVGMVNNGADAMRAVRVHQPDVVTMDIQMTGMDGIEATRQIMMKTPVPIVIVSAHSQNAELCFQALEAGALTILDKPPGPGHPQREFAAEQMRQTLKQMARVRVVRRWALTNSLGSGTGTTATLAPSAPPAPTLAPLPARRLAGAHGLAIVGIGASTGGPPALLQVLRPLPANFRAPILVVQHIADGFLAGLKTWLEHEITLPIHVAASGITAEPGHVYLAPEDKHLGIDANGQLVLSYSAPEGGHRPAVSHLLRSLGDSYGSQAVGVLLTGMGKDGAQELARLHDLGGITIAQDKESSVVHGMPGEAIRLNAATHVQSPPEIGSTLIHLFRQGI